MDISYNHTKYNSVSQRNLGEVKDFMDNSHNSRNMFG